MTAGLVTGAGLLAACGAGGGGENAPAAVDLKGTGIELWAWAASTHPEGIAQIKVAEDFTAKNPQGVSVTTVADAAPSHDDRYSKIVAALTAGTPPDLLHGQSLYLSDLSRQGAVLSTDDALKTSAEWKKARAAVPADILKGLSWKGQLFAVPIYSSHFTLYYLPEALKRTNLAPPPKGWTWEQFVDYQKKAAQPPDVTGYDDNWTYARTGMLLLANGHKFLSDDGTKFSMNSPEALEAVEFQLGLVRQGLMRAHNGSPGGGYAERLPDAKVVFQFAVAARVPTYRRQGTQFGTAYYPVGPKNRDKASRTHGEAYAYAVFKNKDGKKQQAALAAALWGARPETGLLIAREAGTPPSYKSTVEDPAFQAQFRGDAESWPFYDLLSGFTPFPNFPGFIQARTLIDAKLGEVWAGTVSARDGLAEMTRLGQERLDQALRG